MRQTGHGVVVRDLLDGAGHFQNRASLRETDGIRVEQDLQLAALLEFPDFDGVALSFAVRERHAIPLLDGQFQRGFDRRRVCVHRIQQ